MVFKLRNQLTTRFMSGIILNSYLISMLGGCYIEETKYIAVNSSTVYLLGEKFMELVTFYLLKIMQNINNFL